MSRQPQRVIDTAFKETLMLRLAAGETVAALLKETGILRKSLYEWRDAYRKLGVAGLNQRRGPNPEAGGRVKNRPPAPHPAWHRGPVARRMRGGRAQLAMIWRKPCQNRRAGAHHRLPAGHTRKISKSTDKRPVCVGLEAVDILPARQQKRTSRLIQCPRFISYSAPNDTIWEHINNLGVSDAGRPVQIQVDGETQC